MFARHENVLLAEHVLLLLRLHYVLLLQALQRVGHTRPVPTLKQRQVKSKKES